MVRLNRSTADSADVADIVIIGVQDESGSHAKRKGTSRAPDVLRIASNEAEFFERNGRLIPTCPMSGSLDGKRVFDSGNINSSADLYRKVHDLASRSKIPFMIGGDHSLTTEAIRGISEATHSKLALLYFDAHPDFVTSTKDYYGSVISDSIDCINIKKSVFVGIRACEPEEIFNLRKYSANIIDPIDIQEYGSKQILKQIIQICTNKSNNNIYKY